jgi:hypothetical protein
VTRWVDAGVAIVPFLATDILGVSLDNGPGVTVLARVPPPCILATFQRE